MAAKKTQPKPAPEQGPAEAESTTDYTRAAGHVLTDMGWVPEGLVEKLGATRIRIDQV